MIVCYNKKRFININFLVTVLQNLGKVYKGLNNSSEITFRDKILSQELDILTTKTNTVYKIKTANIFKQEINSDINTVSTEESLIIYVDLSKVNNVIHDEMYKYMLTQICKILKEEKKNEKK